MAALDQKSGGSSLPEFTVPAGKELWELGKVENWSVLEALLRPFDFGSFWVLDEATDKHLAGVCAKFDDSCGGCNWGRILNRIILGGDNARLLQKVLALGANPDLPKTNSWRPSHDSAYCKRPKCARALSLCRPSLTAVNGSKPPETVFQEAKKMGDAEVIAIWEKIEKEGFPSVAKLAFLKEWAALQNLCRRRVISADEAKEKFDGKNAAEWAEHHGEMVLAKELRYLLNFPSTTIRPLVGKAKTFFADTQSRMEALNEQLVVAVETLSKANWEIAELRREVDSLKAAAAAKDEKIAELEEAVSNLQGKTKDLADGVEELNGVFDFLKATE